METTKKTSLMLAISKAASHYMNHFDEINKDSEPPVYINPVYNPYIH